jgi:hypothetical protein
MMFSQRGSHKEGIVRFSLSLKKKWLRFLQGGDVWGSYKEEQSEILQKVNI